MKTTFLLLGVAAWTGLRATGTIVTEPTRTFTVGYDLADLENPPASFLGSVTDSAIVSLTDVRVGLNLVGRGTGGFASEIYVSLNKDLSLTSVLLNRVGVTSGDPVGFGYDGWNVTFADGGAGGDVHDALLGSGLLTGEFEPDGRISPTDSARPALLGVFDGGTGNGYWWLSAGDLDLGGTMRLESWSLTLTGETDPARVPEASTVAVGLSLTALALWQCRRRRSPGERGRDGQ